jgi:hypothetical protein
VTFDERRTRLRRALRARRSVIRHHAEQTVFFVDTNKPAIHARTA